MTPYYSDESVTLWHGDYRDFLPGIGRAFDLVIADPPYAETNLRWDRWPDGWPSFVAPYAKSMWSFGSLRMFMERAPEFAEWKLSQDVIGKHVVWEKHNGSNLAADRFARVHEHAAHWYRGPWSEVYVDVPVTMDATARTVRKKARPAQWVGATGPTVYTSEDGGPRLMRSVIYCRSMHGRAIHPTQKPQGILEPMVAYGCPPDGVILDLFAGSCSASVAARSLGRRSVAIEADEANCERAATWLASGTLDFGAAS